MALPGASPSLPDGAHPAVPGGETHSGAGIVANAGYSLVSQLASGSFTAVLTLVLVHTLTPSQYGAFALAVGVGTLIALPADFGVSSSTARFVAEHKTNPASVGAILADAITLKLVASAIACGALAALAGPIAEAYHAPLTWPLRCIALAVLGQNFMFLYEGAFIASGRMATYVRVAFGESAVECSASVAIVLAGGGVLGATGGRALGYAFGAGLAIVLGLKAFPRPDRGERARRQSMIGRIARYAVPLTLVDGANALFSMVDVLLIGAYLGSRQVGLFSAPLRLLSFFFYAGNAVSNGVAPRMARTEDPNTQSDALAGGLRALILFHSLLIAPLLLWTRPIVEILLGSSYAGSTTTLRVLTLSVYLGGLAPLVSVSANYLGVAKSRVPLMVGAALLDGAIDVVLIPRIGIVSGAIATAAAYAVMVGGHLLICARQVRIHFARVFAVAGRALLAAAAMSGTLALFGTNPGILMLIVGGITGAAAYALVLMLLGEITPNDLKRVWAIARPVARLT
jgi:stage V sporulation protein B